MFPLVMITLFHYWFECCYDKNMTQGRFITGFFSVARVRPTTTRTQGVIQVLLSRCCRSGLRQMYRRKWLIYQIMYLN